MPADQLGSFAASVNADPTKALPDVVLDVQASVGVALVGPGTADDVLRNADIALYEAKAVGKSRYTVYAD